MIEINNPHITIGRQCDLLGLNLSSYYYEPSRDATLNLALMRLIENSSAPSQQNQFGSAENWFLRSQVNISSGPQAWRNQRNKGFAMNRPISHAPAGVNRRRTTGCDFFCPTIKKYLSVYDKENPLIGKAYVFQHGKEHSTEEGNMRINIPINPRVTQSGGANSTVEIMQK